MFAIYRTWGGGMYEENICWDYDSDIEYCETREEAEEIARLLTEDYEHAENGKDCKKWGGSRFFVKEVDDLHYQVRQYNVSLIKSTMI